MRVGTLPRNSSGYDVRARVREKGAPAQAARADARAGGRSASDSHFPAG